MARFIPDEVVDEIKAKSDIIDVIQSYIPLKRAGSSFKALCPFHNEKTPSFNVNPTRQMFYCFGCGKGGDVVKFVMEKENADYLTALRILANRAGVNIPERGPGGQPGAGKNRKDRLYKMHEELAAFFHGNLLSGKVRDVCGYAEKRAIGMDAIKAFGLGASPDSWDECLKLLSLKEYTQDEMLESGIILRNPDSGKIYDRFRNRLIFPIRDELGRTVGFSGRTVDEADAAGAKYVNSPETPIFRKSRILYAMDKAREGIRRKGFSVICEGQLDVIAMHCGGMDNAVAPQGTAFTSEQAGILRRYANRAFVCFDGDEAGRKAALRAMEILLSLDMEPSVVVLPEDDDPDSILRRDGAETLRRIVEGAIPFFDYLMGVKFPPGRTFSPWERNSAAAEVAEYIAKITSPVLRASFSGILAERTGVPEATIFQELRKKRDKDSARVEEQGQAERNGAETFASSPESRLRKAEEILLELCLMHGTFCRRMAEELPAEMISSTSVGKAIEMAVSMTLNGEWEEIPSALSAKIAEENDPVLCRIVAVGAQYDEATAAKAYEDCMRTIRNYHISKRISSLNEKMLSEKDEEVQQNLLMEISALRKSILRLKPMS